MWIVKYPKPMKSWQTGTVSYTAAPLSEYVGSHIYQMLGIDTQETRLGIRHGKLVVACKDFCQKMERLFAMSAIKNAAHRELSDSLEKVLCTENGFI
jgi:hypothetical protein